MSRVRNTFSSGEQGAALLVVLLLVATLSVVSLSVIQLVTTSTRVAAMSGARSQAVWYVRGAEDLARVKIAEMLEASGGKVNRYIPGLGQEIPFNIEGGSIMARLDDFSNCFNLNSLAQVEEDEQATGSINAAQFYKTLLLTLDIETILLQR